MFVCIKKITSSIVYVCLFFLLTSGYLRSIVYQYVVSSITLLQIINVCLLKGFEQSFMYNNIIGLFVCLFVCLFYLRLKYERTLDVASFLLFCLFWVFHPTRKLRIGGFALFVFSFIRGCLLLFSLCFVCIFCTA